MGKFGSFFVASTGMNEAIATNDPKELLDQNSRWRLNSLKQPLALHFFKCLLPRLQLPQHQKLGQLNDMLIYFSEAILTTLLDCY